MNNIRLRTATLDDAAGIARVRVDSWRATYRGMIPDTYLDGMRIEDSTSLWTRILAAKNNKTSIYVAENDTGIIGFAAGKQLDEPRLGMDAELAAIYLDPEVQRQRLGTRLVSMVADAHHSMGAQGLLVWVLAKNQAARQFYEGLGAELLEEQPFTWDGLDLIEAGYGWRDLDTLRKLGSAAVK